MYDRHDLLFLLFDDNNSHSIRLYNSVVHLAMKSWIVLDVN